MKKRGAAGTPQQHNMEKYFHVLCTGERYRDATIVRLGRNIPEDIVIPL